MSRELFLSAVREDYCAFLEASFGVLNGDGALNWNWHLEAITHKLDQVERGDIRRLIITVPPRSLKSFAVSVAWPAYLLGRNSRQEIMNISYGEDLAVELARKSLTLMKSSFYADVFPNLRLDREAVHDLRTSGGGGRFATTNGGVITGRGGDIIILDDPQKPVDAMSDKKRASTIEWFGNTVSTRINDKSSGAIVLIQQRLHEDDLAGHLLRKGGWTHLNLPAIATKDEEIPLTNGRVYCRRVGDVLHPDRESSEQLKEQKESMGSYSFAAQYQQAPVPLTGNIIRPDWFSEYRTLPEPKRARKIVQSWDFAIEAGSHNDYTVCISAAIEGQKIWLLDVYRDKIAYPDQRRKLIELGQRFEASVILVERAANGSALISDLCEMNHKGIATPIGVMPRDSKEARLSIESSRIEAGDVFLPANARWAEQFLSELSAFPRGCHDDQVDALTQLMAWTRRSVDLVDTIGGAEIITAETPIGISDEEVDEYGWRIIG